MAIAVALAFLFVLAAQQIVNGKGHQNHKRVIIHVPYKIKHHYHTHTVIKHILHDKEDKYEFLGYSVGKPEEVKDGEVPVDSPVEDVGHSFEDDEHSVIGPEEHEFMKEIRQGMHEDQDPPAYHDDERYVHSDGNEYGFEGAGHHVDDNYGQKVNYEKPAYDVSPGNDYGPEKPNVPVKESPGVEYNYGPKNPGYARVPDGEYNYQAKKPDHPKQGSDAENNYGAKIPGYGKNVPATQHNVGAEPGYGMRGYQKEVAQVEQNYGMKIQPHKQEKPGVKDGYDYNREHESYGNRYNYEKGNYMGEKDHENYGVRYNYNKETQDPGNVHENYGIRYSYGKDLQESLKDHENYGVRYNYGKDSRDPGRERENYGIKYSYDNKDLQESYKTHDNHDVKYDYEKHIHGTNDRDPESYGVKYSYYDKGAYGTGDRDQDNYGIRYNYEKGEKNYGVKYNYNYEEDPLEPDGRDNYGVRYNYNKGIHEVDDGGHEIKMYGKIPGYSIDPGIKVKGYYYGKDAYHDVDESYGVKPYKYPSIRTESYTKEIVHRRPVKEKFEFKDQGVRGESFRDVHYGGEGDYDYDGNYDYK